MTIESEHDIEGLQRIGSVVSQVLQRMLDAMCIAAFGSQEQQGDVQGYGWFYGPYGPVYTGPTFYQTGYAPSWQATPWGPVYQAVPTGYWAP